MSESVWLCSITKTRIAFDKSTPVTQVEMNLGIGVWYRSQISRASITAMAPLKSTVPADTTLTGSFRRFASAANIAWAIGLRQRLAEQTNATERMTLNH